VILNGRIVVRPRTGGFMVVSADGNAYHVLGTTRTRVAADQMRSMFISMKAAINAIQAIDNILAIKGEPSGHKTD
jgi:hypothetical protein